MISMKRLFFTALCVFSILISQTGSALSSELPGLRDMRWGQNIQSIQYLKYIKSVEGFNYYKKLNEQTHIGAVALTEVRYVFYANRLEGLQLISYGKKDAEKMFEALTSAHGSPDRNYGDYAYWYADRLHISYDYNPYSEILSVSYATDKACELRRGKTSWQ